MSHDEIFEGKACAIRVVDHRGTEVQVLWETGIKSWERLSDKRKEIPDIVAEYALRKNLTHEKRWKWAEDYKRFAPMVAVTCHRCTKEEGLEFEVYYDGDKDPQWVDMEGVDASILEKYVNGKGKALNRSPNWRKMVDEKIQGDQDKWFESLQEVLSNVKDMTLRNRVTTTICTKFKKFAKDKGIHHPDTIDLGSAYKQSIDIAKHGGRVILPPHLREIIASKTSSSLNAFIQTKEAPRG